MSQQQYETDVNTEYIITGNDALVKCNIPSFMSDFVSVESWMTSEGQEIHSGSSSGNWQLFDLPVCYLRRYI